MDEHIDENKANEMLDNEVPDVMKQLKEANKAMPLEELFPGESNASVRESIREKTWADLGNGRQVGVILNDDDYVVGLAAKVSRTPQKSYNFVKNIQDFAQDTDPRTEKIQTWYEIYHKEGMVNNAINTTAALVSAEGNYYVRRARQGNRKITMVEEELQILLDYFRRNVNNRGLDGPVTGARGLAAVINQATRQALIEGSWFGYAHYDNVDVPSLAKSFELPMFLQTISSQYIEIPNGLAGTGLEVFYWRPPSNVINSIIESDDEAVQELMEQAFDTDVISELEDEGRVQLQRDRVFHVKHRGVEVEPFGESFIEPIVSDLAYKRALQALDFVTVEAMVNRIMIVKVGSENPDSDYHNIEFAQKRLQLLERMFDTVDPSMTLLWAGPDIDVIDVGVHGKVAELDGRYEIAHERMLYSIGVPKALLIGESTGQVWASYEGYKETLRAMQNDFAKAMVSIGEKIAARNGFEGVELEFEFERSILADQTSSADLSLRARKAGLASIRKTVSDLGGDYEAERRARLLERGIDPEAGQVPPDEEIFSPPLGMPGDTRTNQDGDVVDPGGEPGRRPDSQREDLENERDPEQRTNPNNPNT